MKLATIPYQSLTEIWDMWTNYQTPREFMQTSGTVNIESAVGSYVDELIADDGFERDAETHDLIALAREHGATGTDDEIVEQIFADLAHELGAYLQFSIDEWFHDVATDLDIPMESDANPFKATHVLDHNGKRIPLMCCESDDDPQAFICYTKDEWSTASAADYEYDARTGFVTCLGQHLMGEWTFDPID